MKFTTENKTAEPAAPVTRAFEAAATLTNEPASGATPGWVSVSSDGAILSMVRSASLRACGFERACTATPDNPDPRQPAYVILSHAPGAIRGDWVKDGAVLRDGHGGDTIGRLVPAYVRNGKLGGDQIIFGSSERAQIIKRDVESGVRRNISVEGDWSDNDLVLEGEKGGIPVIRAARWTPTAAAVVDVPADPKVGVARSHDAGAPEPAIINPPKPETPAPATITRTKTMNEQESRSQADKLAADNAEIFVLARTYNIPSERVTEHIKQSKGLQEFQSMCLREYAVVKAQTDAARTAEPVSRARKVDGLQGTIPAETLAQFSLLRAIRGAARRQKPDMMIPDEDDGIEREVCQETVRLIRQHPEGRNYSPQGLPIAWDLLAANSRGTFAREFNIAGTSSNIIAQNLRPELFIDFLRAKLVLANLGVTTLTGLVGDVLIPKQSGTVDISAMASESVDTTSSDPTVGQIKLTPHLTGVNTIIPRQTLLQTTPSADMLVTNDQIGALARKIQSLGLVGSGQANQVTGLLTALASGYQGYAAITEAAIGTDGSPTYAETEAMLAAIEEANVDGVIKLLMRPTAFRYFKTLGRVGTTGFVPAGQEIGGVKYVADLETQTTTSVTTKYSVAGVWDSMVMAMWGAADMVVNPYTYAKRGAIEVTTLQAIDFGYRYLPAFGWSSKFKAS